MFKEVKIRDDTAVVKLKEFESKVAFGQQEIKDDIMNTSCKTQLDTTRLLKICMGIASGVERMDDRSLQSQRQAECRSQTLIYAERRTGASVDKMLKSMTIYTTKTRILLNQLLQR